jgi:apolipoprotein N-acyltransferase
MKKWYVTVGFIVLFLSIILWILIAIIPFLGYSKKEIAGIITVLIIAGEITFYLGIALLGKTIWEKIKGKIMFWKKKTED